MPGRYGTTKADWYSDLSNNMANSTQDAMRLLMQKIAQQKMLDQESGIKSKLLKEQGQQELENAVRKSAAEGFFNGSVTSDQPGIDLNTMISGNLDFGKLRPVKMQDKINQLSGLGSLPVMAAGQGSVQGAVQGNTGPALGDKGPLPAQGSVNMDEYTMNPNYLLTGKGDPLVLKPEVEIQRKAEEQARIAAEKERQVNLGKVGRLTGIAQDLENKFLETAPYSDKTAGGTFAIRSGSLPILGLLDIAKSGLQVTEGQRNDLAYRSFVKGMRAQLARAMGDVGNLNEAEQKAAMELVPTLLDSKETGLKKLQNLRDFIATIQQKPVEARFTGGKQAQTKEQSQLPNGVTMEDVAFTAEKYGIPIEEVLRRIRG